MTDTQTLSRKQANGHGPVRAGLRPRAAEHSSRVTNGKETLPGVDGRSAIARRYHDIASAIAIDQGGVENLTEARLQLIRRFAAAAVIAEQMEARLANGETIDVSEHAVLSSTLVRIARRIGINRTARDVTPSVAQYLEAAASDDPEPTSNSNGRATSLSVEEDA